MEGATMQHLFTVLLICSGSGFSRAIFFEEHPRDIEVTEGGLAILRCAVANQGDAKLYWRYVNHLKNFVVLSENRNIEKYATLHGELTNRISIKGDSSHGEYNLFIRNVRLSDQRQYLCSFFINNTAYDSNRAEITVQPRNSPIPADHASLPACSASAINPPGIFNIGSLVRFTCATPSGSPAQNLTWTVTENGERTILVSCPGSPCIYNWPLSVADVNREFVCELEDEPARPNRVECTYTPLHKRIGVVIDPPVFDGPPGHRQGFMCFSVSYDANNLSFEWYRNSERIPNGSSHSLLNLMITREDAGSVLSCVVSTLNGSFRGIGHAQIEPFDPSDVYPDVEGSSSPSLYHVSTRKTEVESSSRRSESFIKYTTPIQSAGPVLSIQPIAEISGGNGSPKHLSILVVVSAIAGALVMMLICSIGMVVLVFVRKRRKQITKLEQNGAARGNGNCGQLEMGVVESKHIMTTCVNAESDENAINAQRQSISSDAECTFDRFYATLESDEDEPEEDIDNLKKAFGENLPHEKSPALGPPCTPNEYARPQTKPLEIADQLHQGMINGTFPKIHECTMSESSASAYAVTDVVSHDGRFVFKGMSGRDEAHMGVCRQPSGERSATMSRALTRNQTAPPLPARTLPRAVSMVEDQSTIDDSFIKRRPSDSEAIKDKVKCTSKNGFGNRWPWSVRNKKESSNAYDVATEAPEVTPNECESRRLSVASGGSGDYAEITSVDKDSDPNPGKRHSQVRERLDSIPERPASANLYQDVAAYASSVALLENQPKIGKDTTTESGYDRLSRPNQVHPPPLQRSSTMPIYAKVKKSKSLDHDGQRKVTKGEGGGNRGSNRTTKAGNPKLMRSMSEGTAPSGKKKNSRVVGGYDQVEISEKLDHILIQMRDGFTGETVDISEGENKDLNNKNKGSNFADIV